MSFPHPDHTVNRTVPIAPRPPDTPLPPAVVSLTVPADGPVARFARMVDAMDARDYREASRIRHALFGIGWSILPPKTASWTGRRS